MIQTYSMILWSNASKEIFEKSLLKANNLLANLKELGPELSPNYITARKKKDIMEFRGDLDTLKDLLLNGINKEGKILLDDLGYSVSFISSLLNDDSASIRLNIGVSNSRFSNNFVVDFPVSFPINNNQIIEKLIKLYKRCVIIFNPYWACISNNLNMERYENYMVNKIPVTIHWINYFDSEVSDKLGEKAILIAPVNAKEKFHKGYFVMLKRTPLDDNSMKDIILQQNINKFFKL